MIYLKNGWGDKLQFVLYSPITDIVYDKSLLLLEAEYVLKHYGVWMQSKGVKLERPDTSMMNTWEAIEAEKYSRNEQKKYRPDDFPIQAVLMRGPHGNQIGLNYLFTDTSVFDWTPVSDLCPNIKNFILSLPYDSIGRVNIQTVEPHHELHRHLDSILRIDSETIKRRQQSFQPFNISNPQVDVNCFITLVLQGNGITFYFSRSGEKITLTDDCYYFCPHMIHHSIEKSDLRRIIVRIEGKASTKMIDFLQIQALKNEERLLLL
jgi:hypothetical protein